MRGWIVGAAALLFVVTGCGSGDDSSAKSAPEANELEGAHEHCVAVLDRAFAGKDTGGTTAEEMLLLEDSGQRLAVAQVGDIAQRIAAACVLKDLKAPQSTIESISSTSPIMGERSDSWGDDLTATWSVANPGGISLIVTQG